MTQETLKLSNETLGSLPDTVQTPQYDRSKLKPGIVHFGIGAFSRAHIVALADDLANQGNLDYGVVGISMNSGRFRDPLAKQDNLYTLQEQTPGGKGRVIGSLVDVLVATENPGAVIDRIAHPDTKVVTLTITQKGYHYSAEKGFHIDSPEIQHSLANRDEPKAAVAFIVLALERRKAQGLPPITIMSCDNINNNGGVLRATVQAYAAEIDKGLARWIDQNVKFPNTMVDRITPSYKPEQTAQVQDAYGYHDHQPVMTEKPWQLVVEAKPGMKLPPFDRVGAQYVPEVAPYELAKIRLLNGMHMALGIMGRQRGFKFADEALENAPLRTFMQGYMDEVKATLAPIPGFDYDDYIETLFVRVGNPHMKDDLQRLARNGLDKLESRFVGPLEDAYARDLPRAHLVDAVANWITYLQAADPTDNPQGSFFIEDSKAYDKGLVRAAKSLNGSVAPILAHEIWGNLRFNPEFEKELQEAYTARTGGHREPDREVQSAFAAAAPAPVLGK